MTETPKEHMTDNAELPEDLADDEVIVQPVYYRAKYTLRRSPIFLAIMLILVASLAINTFILWSKTPEQFAATFAFLQKKAALPSPTPTPTVTPSPTSTPSVEPSPTPNIKKAAHTPGTSTVYRIDVVERPDAHMPGDFVLRNELLKLFGISVPVDDARNTLLLSYDTRNRTSLGDGKTTYDGVFYAVLKDYTLQSTKYENSYLLVKQADADPALAEMIADPDFCRVDTDCMIRTNFCTYGAFNAYHPKEDVWGCGPLEDEDGKTSGQYDEARKCTPKVTYGSARCENNKCVAQDKKESCD